MIHEFAVDPDAVVSCSSPVKFLDDFGRDSGRLIAPLPKANRWVGAVSRALNDGLQSGQIPGTLRSAKKLEERLATLQLSKPAKDALFSPVRRPYDGTLTWMENATAQHAQQPFHAIVAAHAGAHFTPDDADSLQPLYVTVRGIKVARTAEVMTAAIMPALRLSSRVIFVDPHFDPELQRFRPFLKKALAAVASKTEVTIVTSTKWPPSAWPAKIVKYLQPLVPAGMEVTVLLLEEVEQGPKLHARYVLTDAGGIAVETGLDEGLSGEETDLHLLALPQYEKTWDEYVHLKGFHVAAQFQARGSAIRTTTQP